QDTCVRGRSSHRGSAPRQVGPRAPARPDTVTATWPGSWARPLWWPAVPTPSWANATGALPDGEAKNAPSSPSDAPSSSSSGTCSPTKTPTSPTSVPTTSPNTSTQTPRNATTSANSKPSATPSPSPQRPDQTSTEPTHRHFRIRGCSMVSRRPAAVARCRVGEDVLVANLLTKPQGW